MNDCHDHCHDGCHGHHEHACDHDGCGCHHAQDRYAWLKLLAGGVIFVSGVLVTEWVTVLPWIQAVWMALAVLPLIWPLLKEAVEEVVARSVGENTLLVVAVVAAFVIGECVEGALVLLLFVLGETIERKAVAVSRRVVSSLAAVTPDRAWRLDASGIPTEIPVTQVNIGDALYLPPHSRVPVDCRVLTGESEVNTAALTGESLPVHCGAGDELLSGSVNGAGELTVTALRQNAQSAAARILHLVEEASSQKGRSERFITRFARVYTPAVMVGALLLAIVPSLINGEWTIWCYRALAFLVASCPCALVISIPLCFYAGIAAAARQGMVIKGGTVVEQLARVQAIGFDKTGTLTEDSLTVSDVVCADGLDESEALRLAAALESHSTHPIGRALCSAAEGVIPVVSDLREFPGLGVRGAVDGMKVACGSARLMAQLQADVSVYPPSPVYVWRDGAVIAAISLSSVVREGAPLAIRMLRTLGVSTLTMLTGDRPQAAQSVAVAVGLENVQANLSPEDKLDVVRAWQGDGLVTLFVGDGINDTPVLAAADVGVAMGLGSSAAIEVADAVLVSGGLIRLPRAIMVCRRTVRTVRANIFVSLGVKFIVLLLAAIGLAPMWLAVFADTGVTVLCVLNALRLLWMNSK